MMLGWILASAPVCARGQEGSSSAPPSADPPRVPAPPSDVNQELLDRLLKMEQGLERVKKQNEELSRENQRLGEQVKDLSRQIRNPGTQGGPTGAMSGTAQPGMVGSGNSSTAASRWADMEEAGVLQDTDSGAFPPAAGGGSKSSGGDPTATGRAQEVGNRHRGKLSLKSYYDFEHDGFRWATEDDEFSFGIRSLTQLEARIYEQSNQFHTSSGFYNPRTRLYCFGQFTKPIQYEISFQNSFDKLDLLDAYLNFNYDSRFQIRAGRYKTPFTYEWYRVHIWHLLAPERSLFANNYEGNRRFGLMGWGVMFDNRFEYAVGTFNTQRNSYQPFDSLQDVMAFLNFKPFYNREDGFLLRDLHVGGSVDAGNENQTTVPAVLRTNSAPSAEGIDSSAASNAATVPFLGFDPAVRELGLRSLWELHTAYYFRGLTLLAAWDGGFEHYAKAGGSPTRIPIGGWFAQVGYIVTGETIRDHTLIDPLHPFDLRHGHFGLGAFELTARYSELELDHRVFTAGLADPNLWTNRAQMTDVGFNWYMNKFVKFYFDWEHAMFATPVLFNLTSGQKQLTSDLFWIRMQLYF
jgi:phosphate-selective porin OprO and OprP